LAGNVGQSEKEVNFFAQAKNRPDNVKMETQSKINKSKDGA